MDIALVAGRDISETDVATSPPIVLVSQAYAKQFFGNENPIGKRILIGCYKGCPGQKGVTPNEIVGVVADIRDQSLEQKAPHGTIWVARAQQSEDLLSFPAFVVRANDPATAANALRRAIAEDDPRLASPDIAAMSDIVSASMSWRRFTTLLLLSFATLALVLTCVGIYGVASYSVSQRVREIGLRMALGALPKSVVALVVRQAVTPAACGLVVGLAGALWLSRVLTNQLFGVSAHDPVSLGSVAGVLMLVAIVASYFPARRAARVDPATALKSE
jgi:putative ABC transport system permease protein